MKADDPHWVEATPSQFTHEAEGLRLVRNRRRAEDSPLKPAHRKAQRLAWPGSSQCSRMLRQTLPLAGSAGAPGSVRTPSTA